jgi:circadian clock protein KaiB
MSPETTRLVLFVRGNATSSNLAISTLRRLCDESGGEYELRVVDVFQEPALAQRHHVMATPTVLCGDGELERRVVGDISEGHLMEALGLGTNHAH